jgi:peptidoglycan/LPS O-acetylase OafA/YrhL
VHWPLLIALLYALLHWNAELTPAIAALCLLALGVPLMLLAAWLLHRFVEAPLMAWSRQA